MKETYIKETYMKETNNKKMINKLLIQSVGILRSHNTNAVSLVSIFGLEFLIHILI